MRSINERTKPRQGDDCGCCVGWYPNGLVSLLIAQVLMLLGFLLSGLSMFDCRFVQADVFVLNNSSPPDDFTDWSPNARTGFGMISYQDASGRCMYESWEDFDEHEEMNHDFNGSKHDTDVEDVEDRINDYIEWLGSDWEQARYLIGATLGTALIVFVWTNAMMCIAHIRMLRIFVAAIPFFLVMPLQFSSLSLLNSDFCEERSCILDRSAIGAICAGFMYFAAGVALMFTKSYTRQRREGLDPQPASTEHRSSSGQPAAIEMVDIVEDASFVIEDDRARANADQVEEVVIGDGLAEALEIKPDMVFLHEDGEEQNGGPAVVHPSSPPAASAVAAAASADAVIPTVTDVQVVHELSKTKVAP